MIEKGLPRDPKRKSGIPKTPGPEKKTTPEDDRLSVAMAKSEQKLSSRTSKVDTSPTGDPKLRTVEAYSLLVLQWL